MCMGLREAAGREAKAPSRLVTCGRAGTGLAGDLLPRVELGQDEVRAVRDGNWQQQQPRGGGGGGDEEQEQQRRASGAKLRQQAASRPHRWSTSETGRDAREATPIEQERVQHACARCTRARRHVRIYETLMKPSHPERTCVPIIPSLSPVTVPCSRYLQQVVPYTVNRAAIVTRQVTRFFKRCTGTGTLVETLVVRCSGRMWGRMIRRYRRWRRRALR